MQTTNTGSAGATLRAAIDSERPLQIVGAINAYCALLAEREEFRAIYLSGAGIANASHGLTRPGPYDVGGCSGRCPTHYGGHFPAPCHARLSSFPLAHGSITISDN